MHFPRVPAHIYRVPLLALLFAGCALGAYGPDEPTGGVESCALPYTAAYTVQGSGLVTPMAGHTVTTQGVVVGDYEGAPPALRGFYLQDLTGDGDPGTSDGVFVFNGMNNSVNPGDVVRVTGTAGEFEGQTQISSVASVTACGTGSVTPADVTLPFPDSTYLER